MLNGKMQSIPSVKGTLLKNQIEAKTGYSFEDGDSLEILGLSTSKTCRFG